MVFVGVSLLDVGVIVNFGLELGVKNVLNGRVCLKERMDINFKMKKCLIFVYMFGLNDCKGKVVY